MQCTSQLCCTHLLWSAVGHWASDVHMFPSTLFLLCVSLPYSSRTAPRNPWHRWQAEHLLHQLHPSVTLLCSFLPISGPLAQQARPDGLAVS